MSNSRHESKPLHNDANKTLPTKETDERIPGEKLRAKLGKKK
ncbi:hypothetical protein [Alicyclobacillus vulcanalis]|uniref:Uncharacterized protein n=1 Tax=Alicyclobacillus vulcanalis TaxID=252246 RepID=A0A1N7N5D4_9BACL|nr:hypothetical protein [Alicyclobacillus vulcanalis]SIS93458.1 hypothetical protein SAMN05421799_10779 [Alicyclobacillus vulcanalis]